MYTREELKLMFINRKKLKNPLQVKAKKSEYYIFDENKSVKWNREEVERYNKEIDAELEQYRKEFADMTTLYLSALDNFLINDSQFGDGKISDNQLQKIRHLIFCNDEDNYYGYNGFDEMLNSYHEYIDLILDRD